MEAAESALIQLKRLKGLCVRLALDDFGTGYSSLSYLHQFPFDHVKIDQSFTAELPHSATAVRMAEAIHELASALGMQGIAEGVERPEQAHALRELGWEYAQGFLYSRPVEAATAAEMVCPKAPLRRLGSAHAPRPDPQIGKHARGDLQQGRRAVAARK